jgi:hypothetical protein
MSNTDALISQLSDRLEPVQPLGKPWLRAALWSAFATLVVAVLATLFGTRADIAHALGEPKFVVPLVGSWLTGVTAAIATFEVSLPDRSRRWLWLPIVPVLLWGTGFAYGCLTNWVEIPAGLPLMPETVACTGTILLTSAGLLVVLVPMLRKVRTLRPRLTAWLGCLAVAGFADTAHLLIHTEQASLLSVTLNLVPGLVLVLAARFAGRRVVA